MNKLSISRNDTLTTWYFFITTRWKWSTENLGAESLAGKYRGGENIFISFVTVNDVDKLPFQLPFVSVKEEFNVYYVIEKARPTSC